MLTALAAGSLCDKSMHACMDLSGKKQSALIGYNPVHSLECWTPAGTCTFALHEHYVPWA